MRSSIYFSIAGLCFSAIVPTAVSMMFPSLDFHLGLEIIVPSVLVGLGALWLGWRAHQQEGRTKIAISGPRLHHIERWKKNQWLISVKNTGDYPAQNVQMKLLAISPKPKYEAWDASYPYPVGLARSESDQIFSWLVNPGDCEDFELLVAWHNDAGNVFMSGIDTKRGRDRYICIETTERWHLEYVVTCGNADSLRFSVVAWVENKNILMAGSSKP